MNTHNLAQFDREALAHAKQFDLRRRKETWLLATIAPAPRFRSALAEDIGVELADFSFEDLNLIYRAILAAHPYGKIMVMKLAVMLLKGGDRRSDNFKSGKAYLKNDDACHWDEHDQRPFISGGSRWSYWSLARLFIETDRVFNEAELIVNALADVRRLPKIPSIGQGVAA